MLLFIALISKVISIDPEFIETVELSYGKFDAYFMSPLEMKEGKVLNVDFFDDLYSLKDFRQTA